MKGVGDDRISPGLSKDVYSTVYSLLPLDADHAVV